MDDHGIKVRMEQDTWGTIKYINDMVLIHTPYHGDTREVLKVSATDGSDLRLAKRVQLENAKNQKEVLSSSKPFAFLKGLCEFSFGIYLRHDNVLNVEIKNEFRFKVKERFRFYNTYSFTSTGNL